MFFKLNNGGNKNFAPTHNNSSSIDLGQYQGTFAFFEYVAYKFVPYNPGNKIIGFFSDSASE